MTDTEWILLNPGPGNTTRAVRDALVTPDLCHREVEFFQVMQACRTMLVRLAGGGDAFTVVCFTGSGTAAVEAALCSVIPRDRTVLVVDNGVYGKRMVQMAEAHAIPTEVIRYDIFTPVHAADVEARLKARPDISHVALVHHETTTGLLNPLAPIADLAQLAGVRVVVDAISSFGVEEIDVQGIDFLTCSSNKCLHGLPGAAFVLVSPAGGRRARSVDPSSVALDLCTYLDGEASGSPPFTPAIPALAALDVALDRALAEGIEGRRGRYADRCEVLDFAFERLGLEQLVAAGARSHSIRSLRLPAGVSFAELHERLRVDGFVVYAGQGALAAHIFRVACMGELELDELRRFVGALERALGELRP